VLDGPALLPVATFEALARACRVMRSTIACQRSALPCNAHEYYDVHDLISRVAYGNYSFPMNRKGKHEEMRPAKKGNQKRGLRKRLIVDTSYTRMS
jgi:hypothetical protein